MTKYNSYKNGEGKRRINECIQDYINGDISQIECCKKHGITINVFRYHYNAHIKSTNNNVVIADNAIVKKEIKNSAIVSDNNKKPTKLVTIEKKRKNKKTNVLAEEYKKYISNKTDDELKLNKKSKGIYSINPNDYMIQHKTLIEY